MKATDFISATLPRPMLTSFLKASEGHWKIENLLHREKDVLHNEDKNGITKGSGAIFCLGDKLNSH